MHQLVIHFGTYKVCPQWYFPAEIPNNLVFQTQHLRLCFAN